MSSEPGPPMRAATHVSDLWSCSPTARRGHADVEKAAFVKALNTAERCEQCILSCTAACEIEWCAECVAAKKCCSRCAPTYGSCWHPDTRPCQCCAAGMHRCVRLRALLAITDQEAKVKKGLEACVSERNDAVHGRLFAAVYDAPHTLRIILRAAMNWTVHDADGCAVTYRVANAFKTCKNQDVRDSVFFISTKAALLQDRMSEQQVAALNSSALQRVFEKYVSRRHVRTQSIRR